MLTDVLGPRMTGTPSFRESGEWAMEIFRDLNLHNVHAEPIDWGRGWVLDHVSLHLIEPQVLPLIGVAVPWSPPTGGTVEGNAVQVTLPEWETPAAYRTFFNAWRGRLANAIILATDEVPRERPEYPELIPTRLTD